MTCKLKMFCKQGETCVAHEGYDIWKCTAFKDKGEPMTNEEWIKQCTTEQLAEWIAKIVDCDCCPVKRKFCDDNPCKIRFVEWLKQPHTTIKE